MQFFGRSADVRLGVAVMQSKSSTSRPTSSKDSSKHSENSKKTESKKTEPKNMEPKKTESKNMEPKKTESKKTEPKNMEPKKTESKKTEPKNMESMKTESKKTEPKKTESKNTEPKKAQGKMPEQCPEKSSENDEDRFEFQISDAIWIPVSRSVVMRHSHTVVTELTENPDVREMRLDTLEICNHKIAPRIAKDFARWTQKGCSKSALIIFHYTDTNSISNEPHYDQEVRSKINTMLKYYLLGSSKGLSAPVFCEVAREVCMLFWIDDPDNHTPNLGQVGPLLRSIFELGETPLGNFFEDIYEWYCKERKDNFIYESITADSNDPQHIFPSRFYDKVHDENRNPVQPDHRSMHNYHEPEFSCTDPECGVEMASRVHR